MSADPVTPPRRRKIWGWGHEGELADPRAIAFAEASLGALFGGPPGPRRSPPDSASLRLRRPRVDPPSAITSLLRTDAHERALHSLGRSYRDLARAVRGEFPCPPDWVAYPRSEEDIVRLLEQAASAKVAVIPFGGGTSVSGGVEPEVGDGYAGTMSIDLALLTGVLEIDEASLSARVLAGTLGPDLEAALRPRGLSLRHFPQSFELSTVGGWIATRAGGHFATVFTHIDDLVASVRMVTPAGAIQTRRLPGSGAGPAPERMLIGSEGTLGIFTEAWLRVFERPRHRASATVRFASFTAGAAAARSIAQASLYPSNCRVLDGAEALMSGAGAGDACLLLLAFESAQISKDAFLHAAVELARAAGGTIEETELCFTHDPTGGRDATADTYKASFFRAPYLRDELVLRGIFVETYETAIPWSKLEALDLAVRAAVLRLNLGPHLLACRLTHLYRDGCAPYYTLIARAPEGGEIALWHDAKAAITDAILEAGGASTHHHAVGRDVAAHYARERPPLFAGALSAAKLTLDPHGIMNPGVLEPARGFDGRT